MVSKNVTNTDTVQERIIETRKRERRSVNRQHVN